MCVCTSALCAWNRCVCVSVLCFVVCMIFPCTCTLLHKIILYYQGRVLVYWVCNYNITRCVHCHNVVVSIAVYIVYIVDTWNAQLRTIYTSCRSCIQCVLGLLSVYCVCFCDMCVCVYVLVVLKVIVKSISELWHTFCQRAMLSALNQKELNESVNVDACAVALNS